MAHNLKVVAETGNGTVKTFNDAERIYYDGYWIRHYEVPDTLAYKKRLIEQLARRVFHHTENGINTPGHKLEEVKRAHDQEKDPARKRVLAAMLAGALLNRGVDILTKMVELEELGVRIEADNELLKSCGRCFMSALEYGRYIRPRHGAEGLDELWGEPFKAFTMPTEQFHETRYIKIAQTMGCIDTLAEKICKIFHQAPGFGGLCERIEALADSCKHVCETLRSDPVMLELWPRFVCAADSLKAFRPHFGADVSSAQRALGRRGRELVQSGTALIIDMSNMRIPLPRSTRDFLQRCDEFQKKYQRRLA